VCCCKGGAIPWPKDELTAKEISVSGKMAGGKVGIPPPTIPPLASESQRTSWARHRRRLRRNSNEQLSRQVHWTSSAQKNTLWVSGYHTIPEIGDIKLNKLTSRTIQKLYNNLKNHGRIRDAQKEKNPGLSSSYVRGIHTMLHHCLDRAVKERLIPRNPTDECIIPKIQKREIKILPAESLRAYLHGADERGVLPMFFLELVSGVRKGELVALLWSDLDVQNKTISVSKQATVIDHQIQVTRPKTETSIREVSIPQEQEAVDLLVQEHEKHPSSPYIFPSPKTGRMYHPDSVVNLHKRILRDAGLEHIPFHALRHTFATTALQTDIDVKTVSSMLGHYSAGFTLNTYTHATTRMQEKSASWMDSYMAQNL